MDLRTFTDALEKKFQARQASVKKLYTKKSYSVFNESYGEHKFHIKRAYDCYIEDLSGRRYIDTTLAAGTHLLGYSPPFLKKTLIEQCACGTLYITANEHTHSAAQLLNKILPHFDGFVFCSSGSEATMRAARIARAYSKKQKIAVFSGSWHGGTEFMLYDDDYKSSDGMPNPILKSAGVPKDVLDYLIMLPYNDPRAFEIIEKNKDDIAMVIIEPSQGSNPRDDLKDFLKNLRDVTTKHNIILCFDEMITGFRVRLGGCQEYYGIKADMATYGKAIGGGLPIGVVAGRKDIMKTVKDAGVFTGGTFSANPLVMYMVKTLLEYLMKNKSKIYPYLTDQGDYFRHSINQFCSAREIPVRTYGIGSMLRPIFTDHFIRSRWERERHEASQEIQNLFYMYVLLEYNIHVNNSKIFYLSTAHKPTHIKDMVKAMTESLDFFARTLKAF